jgi:hypothetical protein
MLDKHGLSPERIAHRVSEALARVPG